MTLDLYNDSGTDQIINGVTIKNNKSIDFYKNDKLIIKNRASFLLMYHSADLNSKLASGNIKLREDSIAYDYSVLSENELIFSRLKFIDILYKEAGGYPTDDEGNILINDVSIGVNWNIFKQIFNEFGYHIYFLLPDEADPDFDNLDPNYDKYFLFIKDEKGLNWNCVLDNDINPDDVTDFETNYRNKCKNTKHYEQGQVLIFSASGERYYEIPNNLRNYFHTVQYGLRHNSDLPVADSETDYDRITLELVVKGATPSLDTVVSTFAEDIPLDKTDKIKTSSAAGWFSIPYGLHLKLSYTKSTSQTGTISLDTIYQFEVVN